MSGRCPPDPQPEHGKVSSKRRVRTIGLAALRDLRERHLAALRAQLDADELAPVWAEIRAISLEQAVEYALDTDEASPPLPP